MVASVPSLEGSLYLTDPQSIVAYVWRRYCRTPKDTIPILSDMIISLPYQHARFNKEPEILCSNMQSDLQGVLSRIFGTERNVTVLVSHVPHSDAAYDVNVVFTYVADNGEPVPLGTTISLDENGQLVIPEDTIKPNLGFN